LSAPFIWIGLPAAAAILLLVLNRWNRSTAAIAAVFAMLLAISAVVIPIGQEIFLGPFAFQVRNSFSFFGRLIVIQPSDVPVLAIVFAGAAVWNGGTYLARASRYFPAVSIGISGLLVAALTVQPFIYSAMVIELIALACVPLLVTQGQRVGKSVLRYITFLTLGMPFILFVGWMLSGTEESLATGNIAALHASMLLLVGFMFLLAVFPVHSWVPTLMQETQPYSAAFVIFFITQAALFFARGIILQYPWVNQSADLWPVLRGAGLFIITINGVWLAFQRDLGRIFGFMLLAETGYSLLTLGLLQNGTSAIFIALLITRMLAAAIWAYSLAQLYQKHGSLAFNELVLNNPINPWIIAGIVLSQLSLLGMPLLASFPVKLALFGRLAGENALFYFWIGIGITGALVIVLRSLQVLSQQHGLGENPPWPERRFELLPIWSGLIILFFFGLFPGLLLSGMLSLISR
jgi:NADH-quinone oxidoreductase subunit N